MKLQITESVENLSLCLVQVFCYFLKFCKVCRMFEKVADHRSRVPPLAKISVASSFQSSDGWMFAKLLSVPWERDGSISDYAQSLIQDIIYKPSTTRTNKTPIFGC